ncbi:hypothetical protein [Pseudoalteromonas rubra]|uniref:hypothetical protein n=1 Tax=Pseudoalteromonas rubra TaxID=43658 RepID=UPI000F785440|nr:hypothetical protein [Pseudoalteromonas rubra]MEC4089771.1 hypothetical protein [Pseudoalteromonas rubra]
MNVLWCGNLNKQGDLTTYVLINRSATQSHWQQRHTSKQVDGFFSFSQPQPQTVRLTAVAAMAQQTKADLAFKPRLKRW